jgi:hypothetical protein
MSLTVGCFRDDLRRAMIEWMVIVLRLSGRQAPREGAKLSVNYSAK